MHLSFYRVSIHTVWESDSCPSKETDTFQTLRMNNTIPWQTLYLSMLVLDSNKMICQVSCPQRVPVGSITCTETLPGIP